MTTEQSVEQPSKQPMFPARPDAGGGGFRPQGTAGPMYNPGRDLAYVGLSILRQAANELGEPQLNEFFSTVLGPYDKDIEALRRGYYGLMQAIVAASTDGDIEITAAPGFQDYAAVPVAIRAALLAKIGEITISLIINGARDVILENQAQLTRDAWLRQLADSALLRPYITGVAPE